MARGSSPAASIAKSFYCQRGTVTASVPEASNQGVEPRKAKATFERTARLLRHADFESVYKQGRRHFSASMTVFYLDRQAAGSAKVPAIPGLRVGFTVGRALGGAVHRNRMSATIVWRAVLISFFLAPFLAAQNGANQSTTTCNLDDGRQVYIRFTPVSAKQEKFSNGKPWAPGGTPMSVP